MQYKIMNIEEPKNDIELQKAKDAKNFTRGLFGIVASNSIGFAGAIFNILSIKNDDYSLIPFAFNIITQTICFGVITPKLFDYLQELYEKKGNEQENIDKMSKGIKG